MAEIEYQRLTRARSRSEFAVAFISRSSLWLGKDHLLCVETSGYTETYKRFYFRDIQAMLLRASGRRALWNWILGTPAAIFLALLLGTLAARSNSSITMIIVYAVCMSVFALPLLVNNFLGPSCVCHLRTAVQIEELPSLNRLRRARKVLDRIRPFIAAAQGEVPVEEIRARMQAAVAALDTIAPRASVGDTPNAPPVIT